MLSASKEVILSAGAFQSPQLLMVSGVGPASTLKAYNIPVVADLPGVGQNMWDHIIGGPSFRVNLLTTTELSINPTFATQTTENYLSEPPTGMLTDAGSDFLGESILLKLCSSVDRLILQPSRDFQPVLLGRHSSRMLRSHQTGPMLSISSRPLSSDILLPEHSPQTATTTLVFRCLLSPPTLAETSPSALQTRRTPRSSTRTGSLILKTTRSLLLVTSARDRFEALLR